MTSISINKELNLEFLGRNGLGRMCGANVIPLSGVAALHVEPVTSRGVAARCSIQIPIQQLDEFIQALRSAAGEIVVRGETEDTVAARTEATTSPDLLMKEFCAWGEHPEHPRSDWRYEVANDDTQRGYWDFVAAKLEEAFSDARLADQTAAI